MMYDDENKKEKVLSCRMSGYDTRVESGDLVGENNYTRSWTHRQMFTLLPMHF